MTIRILVISSLFTLGAVATYAQTPVTSATAATTATTSATPAKLTEYAGTYTFASGGPIPTYTITAEGSDLYGSAGMGKYKLEKQEKTDQYKSTSSYGSIITFQRDATTKAITGLTLAAQGQDLTATKDK